MAVGLCVSQAGWKLTSRAPRVTSVARFDAVAPWCSANEVRAVALNAKKEVFSPFCTWGKRVKHSQGKECLCSRCKINLTLAASSAAYSGVYPATPAGLAVPTGTWRDGKGVVIEVHPVSVDHAKGAVEVLHGADIKWGMTKFLKPLPLTSPSSRN